MQSNDEILALDADVLTAAYSGATSSAYEFRSANGVTIHAKYAPHASSASATCEFQVETSTDGTTWDPYGEWAVTAGSGVFTETTYGIVQAKPNVTLVLDNLKARWIRVKAKESATTDSFFGAVTITLYPHSGHVCC